MNKIQIAKKDLLRIVESCCNTLIKENYNEGDPRILQYLNGLCKQMGALYAEYDEEDNVYIIEGKSNMKFIFLPNQNNSIDWVKTINSEQYAQAFKEVKVLTELLGNNSTNAQNKSLQ